MGDMGDDFRAMRAAKKNRHKENKSTNTEVVKSWGVSFESKNNGEHFIIYGCKKPVDFWPSSGRWISRSSSGDGYSILTLFQFITKNRCKDEQT